MNQTLHPCDLATQERSIEPCTMAGAVRVEDIDGGAFLRETGRDADHAERKGLEADQRRMDEDEAGHVRVMGAMFFHEADARPVTMKRSLLV